MFLKVGSHREDIYVCKHLLKEISKANVICLASRAKGHIRDLYCLALPSRITFRLRLATWGQNSHEMQTTSGLGDPRTPTRSPTGLPPFQSLRLEQHRRDGVCNARARSHARCESSVFAHLGWGYFWPPCIHVFWSSTHVNTPAAKCTFVTNWEAQPDVGLVPSHTWFEGQSTPIPVQPNEALGNSPWAAAASSHRPQP